jgi:hypothetical protein
MYYQGLGDIAVKPVTRRLTLTRGQRARVGPRYLQRTGRKPINRRAYPTMGTPLAIDMSMEPGQFGRGHHGITSQFGESIFDTIAPLTTSFISTETAPSVPSVIAAPASAPSSPGFISSIFDSAANFMKNISVSVDPLKTIQGIQQIIKPSQAGALAAQLQRYGINPAYMGIPVNQYTAQYGYQAAGINWQAYLPYIAIGGAALFLLPMLMGKK